MRAPALLMLTVWTLGTLFWWGLAFYPAGAEAPEWLAVARDVCFGTAPDSGLPNAAGWMVLILGPLSFVLVGLVTWPAELASALRGLAAGTPGRIALALTLAAVVAEGSWVARRLERAARLDRVEYANPSREDLPANYPRGREPAADFALVDQHGATFRLSDHRDETILLTFAFAHCQTVCPVLVRQVLDVGKAFADRKFRVVILTLDPWRDTPKSLPFLAERWRLPANAHVLSGPVEDVTATLTQFRVPFERDERTGDVVHPALVYLIEPGGRIAYTFNNAPDRWLHQALERMAQDGLTAAISR